MKRIRMALVGAAAALALATAAEAKTKYLVDVDARYPAAKASCATCHSSETPTKASRGLNRFGLDVKRKAVVRDAAGKKVLDLSKIETLDSDGDGKSNLDELKTGTNPGDPASK